jgi:hypothetical protein
VQLWTPSERARVEAEGDDAYVSTRGLLQRRDWLAQ